MEEERQPFAPDALEPAGFSGCSRPALIGCGALFLLLAVVFLIFLLKADDLVRWSLVKFEEQVLQSLPAEVTEAERQRLESAFADAIHAVESGRANPEALPEFQRVLLATSSKIDALTREDVLELTAALEAIAEEPPPEESARGVSPAPVRVAGLAAAR